MPAKIGSYETRITAHTNDNNLSKERESMSMAKQWVNFYNKVNGKKLGGYTVKGTSKGELRATLELKAYDNDISISDIEVRYESK